MDSRAQLLTLEARRVLVHGQEELGRVMGASRRTVQRWDSGRGRPTAEQLARLVVAVHPRDAALAARLAAEAGTTLEALGLVPPPPPAAPLPAVVPPPPPPPPPVSPRLVDTVVCAAAEALNVPPPSARPVLLAAFARAHEVGLSVEDVVKALSATDGNGSRRKTKR